MREREREREKERLKQARTIHNLTPRSRTLKTTSNWLLLHDDDEEKGAENKKSNG